jgi:hypothetical protein
LSDCAPAGARIHRLLFVLALSLPWGPAACALAPDRNASAREWDHAQCLQILADKERKRCLDAVDAEYPKPR